MALAVGARLGPYEIVAPLGAGGMGEVYRARDGRLERDVAIKVLPEHFAGHPEALGRFEREARLVAALNHPNILGIFDFGRAGDTVYAVMELLEGESLRSRIAKGPVPIRQAVDLAIQMAEGLAAAHGKGVLHRDLKPDNLWITRDGRLKILDFGLAKQVSTRDPHSASLDPTATLGSGDLTEQGRIMGTLGYMSPEQLRGEPVDARTDLFSFGATLFEMTTGRRAFARNTPSETMAAVLRDDPGADLLSGAEVSPPLQRIILRCLEKEPARRFQAAADLAFALESAPPDPGARLAPAGAPAGRERRPYLLAAAIGLLGLALGAGTAVLLRPPADPAPVVAIRLATYSGHDTSPAVSPDGRTVAFTSDRDGRPRIWLKQLKGGGELALTDGPDDFARFSPDGTAILFIRTLEGRTSLHRLPLLGNNPHKVVEDAEQADWSPDGKQIAFVRLRSQRDQIFSSLLLIGAEGGAERELVRFEGELTGFPRWSPDGRRILVNTPTQISSGVQRKFLLVEMKDGKAREIPLPPPSGLLSAAAWESNDEFVFLKAESPTGGGTAVSAARAFRMNFRTGRVQALFWVSSTGQTLDLLRDGRIIFDTMTGRQNLREHDLAGRDPPRWLTHGTINDRQPVFDPDGEWVVFSSNRSGNLDLWATSTRSGVTRSITDDPADDWDPAFSPDGRSLLWSSNRTGNLEIWTSNRDGSGARQVTHDGADAQNPTQTRDGKWILYSSANREHQGLWKIHPDGSGAEILIGGAVQIPQLSPDDAYATYLITARTLTTLHVVRVEDGTDMTFAVLPLPRRKTSIFPGRARWTPDGKRILFTGQDEEGRDGVFIQDFVPGRDTSATRRPLAGFDPDWITESLGLSPDGKRLVLSESERIFSLMIAEGVPGLPRSGVAGESAR